MTQENFFRTDDVFVLGKLGLLAVRKGLGKDALTVLSIVQQLRPHNAAAFMLESMYLFSCGRLEDAMSVLEKSDPFQALSSRDEAVAYHLFLLGQMQRDEELLHLCNAYLEEDLITSEAARHTILTTIEDAQARMPARNIKVSL